MVDPSPNNDLRASWASNALQVFIDDVFNGRAEGDDRIDAITDLITDLLHLARREGEASDLILARSVENFIYQEREQKEIMMKDCHIGGLGWFLSQRDDGFLEIQKDDGSDHFGSDAEVMTHLETWAHQKPNYALALKLNGTSWK